MLLRILLFGLMAAGLAGFGTVAWVSTRPPPKVHGPVVPHTAMIVSAHALKPGALLQPNDIASRRVVSGQIPPGGKKMTPAAKASLLGAMIRHNIPAGAPILDSDVLRPGDHGYLAAVLRPGMVAVSVGVDLISGTSGLIWPGDHVDLILTQTINAPGQPLGKRIASETVLSNVRVIAIDQHLLQGATGGNVKSMPARTVTLEVTPREAEQVSVATTLGRLSLAVRSAAPGPVVAAKRLPSIVWSQDVSPALASKSAPKSGSAVVRVFQGAGAGKEFRF